MDSESLTIHSKAILTMADLMDIHTSLNARRLVKLMRCTSATQWMVALKDLVFCTRRSFNILVSSRRRQSMVLE